MPEHDTDPRTLAIDVGASGVKAAVLDLRGEMMTERVRIDTPKDASPDDFVAAVAAMVEPLRPFDRVSVGYPGVVRHGVVKSVANLTHDDWSGYDLAGAMREQLGVDARVINDADMQGLGAIAGEGVEVVVTLGTGFGFGVFVDGRLGAHLEIGHHPLVDGKSYEQLLGDKIRKAVGKQEWNRRLRIAIDSIRRLTAFDRLYLGGGNAKKITLDLEDDVVAVSNRAGITGGIALWEPGRVLQ